MPFEEESEERIKELLTSVRGRRQRVLITGGLGHIGSQLVEQMQKYNIDYISIDKLYPKNLVKPEFLQFNLCDKQKTAECTENFRPDIIVHCGTNSALDYYNQFFESFKEDSQALINILEALSNLRNCRLVFFSTSYVYSGLKLDTPNTPVTETDLVQPTHNFGIAKLFFEQLILKTHKNSVVFRLSSVFGPGNASHPNAVLNMTKECLETGQLTVWGSGSRMMQYTYIKDVVKYVSESFFLQPGTYNLGGNEYLSVAVAAKLIANFFGASMVFLTDKHEGETLPFMNTNKLKEISGKGYFTPLSDALKEYLNSFKSGKVVVQ